MAGENMDADQGLHLNLYADSDANPLKQYLSNSENADRAVFVTLCMKVDFFVASNYDAPSQKSSPRKGKGVL
jgi:hypothetical protein